MNDDGWNAVCTQPMFVLPILEKIKETRLIFSQGGITLLWKMANYEEARVIITNAQQEKLKSAAKLRLEQHWK